ncbi:hypothetical protein [Paractinoplanes brasiliensis]|uniref:Uncharacterized protein n=1 Tax=Paractinoplanes brasiliensis TaxID=52695 RepID=A0A4R6JK56_9ACTN|nr:hypothetical protein [Actinoplanes brasiliensis]TDO36584.1 hypothetical protein C8E87_0162 [Actinoplanes brasiliensis]GID32448.1 hypothetical protein Abr02nite_74310 [Actinoplanes brasiliensis]
MSDSSRVLAASEPGATPARTGAFRPVLWLLLIVSIAANAISNVMGLNPAVGIASGVLALGCATTLITDHRRRRQS